MADSITFGLAFTGYALLAADASRRVRGQCSVTLTRLCAAVVVAHVLCVWALRFDWSFVAMFDKSPFAFVLFHTALLGIILASLLAEPSRSRLVIGSFAIVCLGAIPAPFRYDEIAVLQIPVLATALAAAWYAWWPHRTQPPTAS